VNRSNRTGIFKREGQEDDQERQAVKLPVKNDLGFFEIRMESIGGLGANVQGRSSTAGGDYRDGG